MDRMPEIASDEGLSLAYEWMCERRREYSASTDVWGVRWRRDEIRPQIPEQLFAERFEFEVLRRVRDQAGTLEVRGELDAFAVVSGTARAVRFRAQVGACSMNQNPLASFMTWTCSGTFLPGDQRGWTKWHKGDQVPQPLLEDWCRDQMSESLVLLDARQREIVNAVVTQHGEIRGWTLHAVNCRTNHCHVVVTAASAVFEKSWRVLARGSNGIRALKPPPRPQISVIRCNRNGE